MTEAYTIGVGTVGSGLWFSYDSGEHWRHIQRGVDAEAYTRALTVSPDDPSRMVAAADNTGLFFSEDGGYRWNPMPSPIVDRAIWSIAIDPVDPARIYVGTRPGAFRSTDGGATWTEMAMSSSAECPIGVSRTTNLVVDPRDHMTIWAGVEVDGVHRSRDGGDTWERLGDIGETPFHGDIHGLVVRDDDLHVTTPFGIASSSDDGESWDWHGFGGFDGFDRSFNGAYCRGVFVKPDDSNTIYVGCGDYIPGATGGIEISRDGGESWTRAELPVVPNSTVYWMGTHPAVPDVVAAATVFGYVYISEDAGRTWSKVDHEFGHIRTICVAPATPRAA